MLACFRNGIQHGATETPGAASNGNNNHGESEEVKKSIFMCRRKFSKACKTPSLNDTLTGSLYKSTELLTTTWADGSQILCCVGPPRCLRLLDMSTKERDQHQITKVDKLPTRAPLMQPKFSRRYPAARPATGQPSQIRGHATIVHFGGFYLGDFLMRTISKRSNSASIRICQQRVPTGGRPATLVEGSRYTKRLVIRRITWVV